MQGKKKMGQLSLLKSSLEKPLVTPKMELSEFINYKARLINYNSSTTYSDI